MAQREGGVARIGQFKVGPNIGEGTFGLVKLGTHIQTQEKVAIKVLEKVKIASKEDLHRVRREIKILKSLRHPNIIQLYEIIEDMENIYLIMEYASKGELFNYIVEHTKLQETEACRLYQQIISAMEYFHRLNIAHRDLKPENLFLDDNYNIKVGDFGLSNYFGSDCLLKTSCGSPCYAAPEMISDRPYSGITVDIWASGVVLYAMLCGYLPFNYPEDQTSILFREIRKGNYKIPPFVGKDARNLIKNILNIDNRTRYTISQIKSHPWYAFHPNFRHQYQGVIVGVQAIPIDSHILTLVTTYGYEIEQVRKDLSENRHNSSTSLYYLLLASQKRLGYVTKRDICSKDFVPEPIPAIQQTAVPQPVLHVSPLRVDSMPSGVHVQPGYTSPSVQSSFQYPTAISAPLNSQPNLGQVVNSSNSSGGVQNLSGNLINRRLATSSITVAPQQGFSPMVQIFSSRDSSREHHQPVKGVLSLNTTQIKEGTSGVSDLPTTQSLYLPSRQTEKHSSAKDIGSPYYGLHHPTHGSSGSHNRTVDVQVPSYAIGTHPQKIVVQTLNTQVELYDKPIPLVNGQSKPLPPKDQGPTVAGSTESHSPTLSPVEKPASTIETQNTTTETPKVVAQWVPETQAAHQPSKVLIESKIPLQVVAADPQHRDNHATQPAFSPNLPSKTPLTAPGRVILPGVVHSEKKPSSLATKANIYNKVEINFITNNFNNQVPADKPSNGTKEASKTEPKQVHVTPIYASSARVLPHPSESTLHDLSHDDRMFMTQRTVGSQPSEDLGDHPALLYNAPTKGLGTVIGRGSGDPKRDDTKYRSLVELGPSKQGTTKPKQLVDGTKITRNFASILSQPASGKLISASQTQIATHVEPPALSLRDSLTGISKGFAKRKNTAGIALQTIQAKMSSGIDSESPLNKTKASQNTEFLPPENGSGEPNPSNLASSAASKIAKTFSKPQTSVKRVQAGNILRGITLGGGTPANPLKKKLQTSILNDYSNGGNTDRKLSTNLETSSVVSGLLDQIRQKQNSTAISFLNTTSRETGDTAKKQTQGSFRLLNLSGTHRRPSMNTSIGVRKPTAEIVSLYNATEGGTSRGLSLEANTSTTSQKKQTKLENSEYLGLRSGTKEAVQAQANVVPPLFASKWSQERKIWINCKPVNLELTSFLPAQQIHAKVLHAAKQLFGAHVLSGADYSVKIPSGAGHAVIQIEEIEDCPGLHTISLYSDLQGIASKIVSGLQLDD